MHDDTLLIWKDFFLRPSRDSYVPLVLVSTKGECERHLIRSSWDSQSRDIGQLSYIIAQQGLLYSLGLFYTIMGYTTISSRRFSNFKMKLTS